MAAKNEWWTNMKVFVHALSSYIEMFAELYWRFTYAISIFYWLTRSYKWYLYTILTLKSYTGCLYFNLKKSCTVCLKNMKKARSVNTSVWRVDCGLASIMIAYHVQCCLSFLFSFFFFTKRQKECNMCI